MKLLLIRYGRLFEANFKDNLLRHRPIPNSFLILIFPHPTFLQSLFQLEERRNRGRNWMVGIRMKELVVRVWALTNFSQYLPPTPSFQHKLWKEKKNPVYVGKRMERWEKVLKNRFLTNPGELVSISFFRNKFRDLSGVHFLLLFFPQFQFFCLRPLCEKELGNCGWKM